MTDIPTGEARCANCGARWCKSGMGTLITDRHGRLSMREGETGPSRCPICGARQVVGKATVTEE